MSPGIQSLSRSELVPTSIETQGEERRVPHPELPKNPRAGRLPLAQATLLHPSGSPEARLVSLTRSGGLGAEKFLLLGTRLKHLQEQHGLKKVVLTSSGKSEGKSLVAANLAISLARNTKQKVLLLEGDLRGPVLSRLFGHNKFNGLTELLRQKEPPGKFLYRMAGLPLWILFAGTLREHPLQLLQSSRLPQLLNQFSESFDWILIDAPPLLPLADADLWTRLSDGALLVVREKRTPKKILHKTLESLGKADLLDLVLKESSGLVQNYYDDSTGSAARQNRIS